MIDITQVIEAVIVLISALICGFLLPLLKKKVGNENLDELTAWVKIAVQAAEQIYQGQGKGKKKKAYVKEFLLTKGLTYSDEEVDALIESVVYEINVWE